MASTHPDQEPINHPDDVKDESPLTTNEHLSYPTITAEATTEATTSASAQPRQILKDRLYVGNLHPTVDEYAPINWYIDFDSFAQTRYSLLQIFSKFGKVTNLDFLFHKTGVMKGKPRGYAFIEYGNHDVSSFTPQVSHPDCSPRVSLLFPIPAYRYFVISNQKIPGENCG